VVRSHPNPDLFVSNVDEAAFDRGLSAPRYNPRALIVPRQRV
tara:strand:+ start:845 stop:970 length:126 start_codon:yes stop_codon:yes gene_type:complete